MTVDGESLMFNYGSNEKAWFTYEDGGMQLYVVGPDGDTYRIDFSKWENVTNPSGAYPAHSMKIYKICDNTGAGIIEETKTIYYEAGLSGNRFGRCYADEYGLVPLTVQHVDSGWYVQGDILSLNRLVETGNNTGMYEPISIAQLYPIQLTQGQSILQIDKSLQSAIYYRNNVAAITNATTAENKYITISGNSTTSVRADHIYNNINHTSVLSGIYNGSGYDSTANIWHLVYSNSIPSPGLQHQTFLRNQGTYNDPRYTVVNVDLY